MPTLGETIRVLAEERVLGENAATLVGRIGREDPAVSTEGERLYTAAQAAFNGLIAQLQLELTETRNPSDSEAFGDALRAAVERRKALLTLVAAHLPPEQGAKSGMWTVITDALAGSVEGVISGVSDAAVTLWKEFRESRKERREEIRGRLEAERWRPFNEVFRSE
jgi:hypothetical protein